MGKSRGEMHWGGIRDRDIKKLQNIYPNFNWEDTNDRQRWLLGVEDDRIKHQKNAAKQSRQQQKENRLHQFEQRNKKAQGW